jgi:hypothetical protein
MRKFGFLFLSLLIVFIFFSGFYLYYVPSNKETQDKYAFLILRNIQSDLEDRIRADIQLYANHLQKAFIPGGGLDPAALKDAARRLQTLGVDTLSQYRRLSNAGTPKPTGAVEKADEGRPLFSIQGELFDISNGRLVYRLYQNHNQDSILLSGSASKPLDDILRPHKNDFYQSFLFLKIEAGRAFRIFKSSDLSLGTDIAVDSLLTGSKAGFYPGILDTRIGDQDFKMFYIPVSINNLRFVMCGFKSTLEYQNTLHEVPAGFIYPIVIVFLLLLITLPLIKLFIMGPAERVRIWDLIGYCFSLFIGNMLITLIIIQVIMLKDSDIRLSQNLKKLSVQINGSFTTELSRAYHQLEILDTLPQGDPQFRNQKDWSKAGLDVSPGLIKALQDPAANIYHNFDRVSWVDTNGKQFIKASVVREAALFADVSKRKYFTDFVRNRTYRLPGKDSGIFTMQPVFNMINGAFRIVIAKRSGCQHAYISTISTDMYSFNQPVLPTGFGFCLVDPDGNVQVHSDSSHNLNENFLDEVENSSQLKAAITARQELFIPEMKFYGKENGLLLTPVNGIPFYLVCFYDNGYVLPVNMRILIFSILFFFAFVLICLGIWLAIFWPRYSSRPLLFSPLDYLPWVIPRQKNILHYLSGSLFLLLYLCALLAITFVNNFYAPQNNYLILILLLLSPLNISCGLLFLGKGRKSANALVAMLFVDVAGTICFFNADSAVLRPILVFQAILLLLLIAIYYAAPRLDNCRFVKKRYYLGWYTLLTELLLVCLSALPAGLFTWYSHNQEILQAVKKEQLSMAFSMENRKNGLYDQVNALEPSIVPPRLFDTLQYAGGIYKIYEEKISRIPAPFPKVRADSGAQNFYFSVSDQFSNHYYDPGSVPALLQVSSDRQWIWDRPDTGWLPFYYTLQPDNHRVTNIGPEPIRLLDIKSKIPERYIYLEDPVKLLTLILEVVILLLAIYKLIRRNSEGIFLKKFVAYGKRRSSTGNIIPLFDEYSAYKWISGNAKTELNRQLQAALLHYKPVPVEAMMNAEEQLVISNATEWKKYYDFLLQQSSPLEKYLLYHFATSGFLNYKNVSSIYGLLDKGLLIEGNEEIRFFSLGFRAFMIQHYADAPAGEIDKVAGKRSSWQSFKIPFMILLIAAATFIFFTRQEAWQRLSALITGIGTSLPLLIGLFRNGSGGSQSSQ